MLAVLLLLENGGPGPGAVCAVYVPAAIPSHVSLLSEDLGSPTYTRWTSVEPDIDFTCTIRGAADVGPKFCSALSTKVPQS